MSPDVRSSRTCVIAGASLMRSISTGQRSAYASHAAIRSTDGCVLSPDDDGLVHRLVRRLVERRRDEPAPQGRARPRQVGVAVACATPRACAARRSGVRTCVVSVIRRAAMRPSGCSAAFSGISYGHQVTIGRVGQQQRDHERVQVALELAGRAQHQHLAGAGVAAEPDLRVQVGRAVLGVVRDDDDAARVLAAGVVRGVDRLVGVPVAHRDDERQHASEGDRAALVALLERAAC